MVYFKFDNTVMNNLHKLINILLIDDLSYNLKILEYSLSNAEYNLIYANSGKDAIAIIDIEKDFAVMLIDIQMPDIDGFQIAEYVRKDKHLKDTPIIFLTATDINPQFISKLFDIKFVDYLKKPLDVDLLTIKVEFLSEVYKKNRYFKDEIKRLISEH